MEAAELAPTAAEIDGKAARVRELLLARDARAVTLMSRESLAWLLGGARVAVPLDGRPVLAAEIDRDGMRLAIHANEVERMLAEELPSGLDAEVIAVPWHEALPGEGRKFGDLAGDAAAAVPALVPSAGAPRVEAPHDLRVPGGGESGGRGTAGAHAVQLAEATVAAELRALRAGLLPVEWARYRALGRETAVAVGEVLRVARPDWSERRLAAEAARAITAIGAEPVVLLAAGEARLGIRHPLPTDAPLGHRAMLAVGARRHGLVASLTRWLGDEPDAEPVAARLREVEADAFAATRPGRSLADVLADIAAAYARHGFDPAEWQRHHQGGPAGYAGRDPKAGPGTADPVGDDRAFAWNPTAPRGKTEDTVRIRGGAVAEVLTADPDWPAVTVRGVPRPLALPW